LSTSASSSRVALAIQPTLNNRVYPAALASASSLLASSTAAVAEEDAFTVAEDDIVLEPSDVNHVWVCTRLPESETKVTLRSSNGRFLAVDSVGRVSADREARGVQEEWEIVQAPGGGFALKGAYNKYLGVDEVAGGKLELRGDSESIDAQETWTVRLQGRFLKEQREKNSDVKRKAGGTAEGLTIIHDVKSAEEENMCVPVESSLL
jgi:protein FRG1